VIAMNPSACRPRPALVGLVLLCAALGARPATALAVCGDGVLDVGEACDDGNLVDGDCCSALCTLEPDTDGDGICDARDLCPTVPDPLQADADADGIGDACDPCVTVGGLHAILIPKLELTKLGPPAGNDHVRMKGVAIVPDPSTLDPSAQGLRLLVRDGAGTIVMDTRLPPGAFDAGTRVGWQDTRTRGGFGWRGAGAVSRLALKAGIGGIRFVALGRAGTFGVPAAAPVTLTLVFEPDVAGGRCAEVAFTGAGTDHRCVMLNGGRRLLCR
jgi:cysteine-rich repeat protein